MIEKARLEELKQESAFVWYADKKLHRINLSCCLIGETQLERKVMTITYKYPFEGLFETEKKKDAEFDAKFGHMERVEKLGLPTWEEVKDCENYELRFTKGTEIFIFSILKSLFGKEVYIAIDNGVKFYFDKDKTEANYNEACELVKKLFEGEKECQ